MLRAIWNNNRIPFATPNYSTKSSKGEKIRIVNKWLIRESIFERKPLLAPGCYLGAAQFTTSTRRIGSLGLAIRVTHYDRATTSAAFLRFVNDLAVYKYIYIYLRIYIYKYRDARREPSRTSCARLTAVARY